MPVAFDEVVEKITDAARHVEADGGASPVLVAVVREFQAKLAKAEKQATDSVPGRDSVMELEQAGDSAKAAAEADGGLSSERSGWQGWAPRQSAATSSSLRSSAWSVTAAKIS